MHSESHIPHCCHLFICFISLLPLLNGCLCFLIALFMVSACLPLLLGYTHKMRNANTNASQLCVIPIILPLCRLPFPWFFTIWVFFLDCFLSFPCPPPLFDGLYVSLSWWLLPAGLGAFGFCLSYPGWVCL